MKTTEEISAVIITAREQIERGDVYTASREIDKAKRLLGGCTIETLDSDFKDDNPFDLMANPLAVDEKNKTKIFLSSSGARYYVASDGLMKKLAGSQENVRSVYQRISGHAPDFRDAFVGPIDADQQLVIGTIIQSLTGRSPEDISNMKKTALKSILLTAAVDVEILNEDLKIIVSSDNFDIEVLKTLLTGANKDRILANPDILNAIANSRHLTPELVPTLVSGGGCSSEVLHTLLTGAAKKAILNDKSALLAIAKSAQLTIEDARTLTGAAGTDLEVIGAIEAKHLKDSELEEQLRQKKSGDLTRRAQALSHADPSLLSPSSGKPDSQPKQPVSGEAIATVHHIFNDAAWPSFAAQLLEGDEKWPSTLPDDNTVILNHTSTFLRTKSTITVTRNPDSVSIKATSNNSDAVTKTGSIINEVLMAGGATESNPFSITINSGSISDAKTLLDRFKGENKCIIDITPELQATFTESAAKGDKKAQQFLREFKAYQSPRIGLSASVSASGAPLSVSVTPTKPPSTAAAPEAGAPASRGFPTGMGPYSESSRLLDNVAPAGVSCEQNVDRATLAIQGEIDRLDGISRSLSENRGLQREIDECTGVLRRLHTKINRSTEIPQQLDSTLSTIKTLTATSSIDDITRITRSLTSFISPADSKPRHS